MRSLAISILALAACGGARARPCDDASIASMRDARVRGERARRALGDGSITGPHRWQEPYAGQGWYPWYFSWDPSLEHERLLAANVGPAEAVVLEHRAACESIPESIQALSPFDSYAFGSARLADGILIHLSADAGPPEVLLVRLRCHETWLRLAPRSDAANDLLSIAGATFVVHAVGRETIEVMMSVADRSTLAEIERRALLSVRRARRRNRASRQ